MASYGQVPTNVSSGLQYLTTVDQLLVKQKIENLEAITGYETSNKYTIKNKKGEIVYYAFEENDCCNQMCFGSKRAIDIQILDTHRNEIIHLYRDVVCCGSLPVLEVFSPPGHLIGTVEQKFTFFTPKFDVKNASGSTVLKIEGPVIQSGFFGDVKFKILSLDKSTEVGEIAKQWGGLMREFFTDADYFGISFPLDLDVQMKAVLLGACFLIDFIYYER